MGLTRRAVLRHALAGSVLSATGCSLAGGPDSDTQSRLSGKRNGNKTLSLLILGGTGFLGPHIVRAALARGHAMTLFNRGRTNTHLFPGLERLVGDRDGKLDALRGGRWDAVIDTSGYVPRLVGDSARLVADNTEQYLFVSTISVYRDFSTRGMDENAPLARIEDPSVEQVTGETYGALKALSEAAAEAALPGRTTVVRPGLICGPGDKTDRYTYWPVRASRGGDMLAPGDGNTFVQLIDGRDLGDWIVQLLEHRATGVFNALSPPANYTMAGLLADANAAGGAGATPVWVDADFLHAQGVQPWSDMPVYMPPTGDYGGFGYISNARAVGQGLTFRPTRQTATDTLAWWREQSAERRARLRAGIDADREKVVLTAWRARQA